MDSLDPPRLDQSSRIFLSCERCTFIFSYSLSTPCFSSVSKVHTLPKPCGTTETLYPRTHEPDLSQDALNSLRGSPVAYSFVPEVRVLMFLDLRRLLELLESSVQKGFGRLFSGPLSMELKTEHFGPRVFGQLGQA